jgi:translation initiation factor 5A
LISPVSARIEVPILEKRSGQVVSIIGDTVQLMDLETYETFETEMPKEDEVKNKLTPGIEVEYWKVAGRIKIIRTK